MASRPRSAPPFAWNTQRSQMAMALVLPTNDHSMHNQLHRNLNPKLQRKDTHEKDGIEACVQILHKQRTMRRAYSANIRRPRRQMIECTNRLAHYNPSLKPADSDRSALSKAQHGEARYMRPYNKPLYSKDEVENIVNTLYKSKNPDSKTTLRVKKPQKIYTAESLDNLLAVLRRQTYMEDNTAPRRTMAYYMEGPRGAGGRPLSRPGSSNRCIAVRLPQTNADIVEQIQSSQKQYSAADVEAITQRIASYDPKKWPPESKGEKAYEPDEVKEVTELPKEVNKRYTAKEVDAITSRLSTYNKDRWPPSSKSRYTPGPGDRTYVINPSSKSWKTLYGLKRNTGDSQMSLTSTPRGTTSKQETPKHMSPAPKRRTPDETQLSKSLPVKQDKDRIAATRKPKPVPQSSAKPVTAKPPPGSRRIDIPHGKSRQERRQQPTRAKQKEKTEHSNADVEEDGDSSGEDKDGPVRIYTFTPSVASTAGDSRVDSDSDEDEDDPFMNSLNSSINKGVAY